MIKEHDAQQQQWEAAKLDLQRPPQRVTHRPLVSRSAVRPDGDRCWPWLSGGLAWIMAMTVPPLPSTQTGCSPTAGVRAVWRYGSRRVVRDPGYLLVDHAGRTTVKYGKHAGVIHHASTANKAKQPFK